MGAWQQREVGRDKKRAFYHYQLCYSPRALDDEARLQCNVTKYGCLCLSEKGTPVGGGATLSAQPSDGQMKAGRELLCKGRSNAM